ncbi:MAG: serine/threonine protein kinase [Acidobacteria bacterium]|nr:serine/threonine protein kinase [Acidobacteriota bacterium]
MQSEKWKKVKALLGDVLELDAGKRRGFLRDSQQDPEVIAEVESLLEFEKASAELMNLAAVDFSRDFFDESESEANPLIGQLFGNYRIIRELGQGGMGAVYLAMRADGKFEQRVALKLLKRELNTTALRRRFRQEREILATLEHPNIARLLDAGTTDEGIPFLVMEYVEGSTIARYCEEKQPSLNERLKLFNKVCEAVAHAHRNLIIHRDLKPSNILVTEKGEPKLLDFGISKLLDTENGNENTAATAFAAMTPEYASPEQIKGEPVTTATDVYSLGVVLYKILTGRHPFELGGRKKSALAETIIETEPTKPSAVFGKRQIKSQSAIRSSQLKGDIDNIVLKALSKEPARRYPTVEQLAFDIWRFIDGLPVAARPATFTYRANKFFRRNKIAVGAALVVFLSLLGGIAVALWQAREANAKANIAIEAQRSAQIETEKAQAEQAKSEKITRFMSKIIGYANPSWYAEGAKSKGQARVLDALEDLGEEIDAEFAAEPAVAAELHHKFGEALSLAAKYDNSVTHENLRKKAVSHFFRALELRRQFYGEWHELVAKDIFYSYQMMTKDPGERAALLMRGILMMRDTNPRNLNFPYMLEAYTACLLSPENSENYESYRRAVQPATDEDRFQIAEKMLRESLPVFRLHYKEDNLAIYSAECKLSYALAMQEKWTDFDEHFSICKDYKLKSNNPNEIKYVPSYVELVEKAVASKGKAAADK